MYERWNVTQPLEDDEMALLREVLLPRLPADNVYSEIPSVEHGPPVVDLALGIRRKREWWSRSQKLRKFTR